MVLGAVVLIIIICFCLAQAWAAYQEEQEDNEE